MYLNKVHGVPSPALLAWLSGSLAGLVHAQTQTTACPTETILSWFQTSPQSFQGPTPTGAAPFLAQTNPIAPTPSAGNPIYPLESGYIEGSHGRDIFELMGNLSPYHPAAGGFGVDEYPLPKGANIAQVHMLQRHGSRYPSSYENSDFSAAIAKSVAAGNKFTGPLEFLNDWSYQLGQEILVPQGRQELFESGVYNFYRYGHLYENSTKLVIRTTTQDRMLKSAENFLAGFFGLEWRERANILTTVDSAVTGTTTCTNAMTAILAALSGPSVTWKNIYLKERTAELKRYAGKFNWTIDDSFEAQSLCPYETISLGYSDFCGLFSYKDWEGFNYAADLSSMSGYGFSSPIGRAMGISYVAEFLARLEGRFVEAPASITGANMTLDTNPITFPLNQSLYFEFTHDANIVATLTAFGMTQFAEFLPASGPPRHHNFVSSKIVPFAGRLHVEVIEAPQAVSPRRSSKRSQNQYIARTHETRYVHFLLNERTLPLHASLKECEYREDGWCELSAFLKAQKNIIAEAQYQYSCNGNWTASPYGSVTNGVPL